MCRRTRFSLLILSVLFGLLAGAATFAQTSAADDSDKFVGRWVSETQGTGSDETRPLPRRRVELQITKNASGFTVERSDRVRNASDSDPIVEESLFKYADGRLERDSSSAKTWEPTEFSKRIVEKIIVLPKGKRLIYTTALQSAANADIPGANRKPLTFSETFSKAKN